MNEQNVSYTPISITDLAITHEIDPEDVFLVAKNTSPNLPKYITTRESFGTLSAYLRDAIIDSVGPALSIITSEDTLNKVDPTIENLSAVGANLIKGIFDKVGKSVNVSDSQVINGQKMFSTPPQISGDITTDHDAVNYSTLTSSVQNGINQFYLDNSIRKVNVEQWSSGTKPLGWSYTHKVQNTCMLYIFIDQTEGANSTSVLINNVTVAVFSDNDNDAHSAHTVLIPVKENTDVTIKTTETKDKKKYVYLREISEIVQG